jgi:hypothetical protein
MSKRALLLSSAILVLIASIVRIRHQQLAWGGYWYVDIVPPWRR